MKCGRSVLFLFVLFMAACRDRAPVDPVTVDGSSTVFPLTEAVAEEFTKTHRGATVHVAFSGTGTGFIKFCRGQIDVANASRPITIDEQKACEMAGVSFVELPVAHDAITIIVNAKNSWASSITIDELRTVWAPAAEKKITKWRQVRPSWPDLDIRLFGPGTESGTFDYFTDVVNGRAGESRKDYSSSGDDKVIVEGVALDELALGYVGYGYFEHNQARLKALAVDDLKDDVGSGPIEPSPTNVRRGVYRPLSRPLFIYVNARRAERQEVKTFAQTYLRRAPELATQAGAIPLIGTAYQLAQQRLTKMVLGTMYKAPESADMGVELLLAQ